MTICGHCLSASFALDKSNFMASDLFNLILSIEFLQRFWSKTFVESILCMYVDMCVYVAHVMLFKSNYQFEKKRNHPTQPTSIFSFSKNQCIRWTFFLCLNFQENVEQLDKCIVKLLLIYVYLDSISQVTTVFLSVHKPIHTTCKYLFLSIWIDVYHLPKAFCYHCEFVTDRISLRISFISN